MGWEYGIRATEPAILPEVVKRVAVALTFSNMYSSYISIRVRSEIWVLYCPLYTYMNRSK